MRMVKIGSSDETVFTEEKNQREGSLEERYEQLQKIMEGPVKYGFTNDYMFRAVLQRSSIVLAEIVRILLYIPEGNQVECEILNPIVLSEQLGDKNCVLDILVLVNGTEKVNLEMQVEIAGNWVKRSMYYAFRMYTDLKAGEDYGDCRSSIHVGFVKGSPFPEDTGFHRSYVLADLKSGHIYSGDFRMDMVNLRCLENAEQEDRDSGLYDWVRLFAATDWKELKAMAQEQAVMKEAIVTLAELNTEDNIRWQCEARRLYEMDQQVRAKEMKKSQQELKMTQQALEESQQALKKNEQALEESQQALEESQQIAEVYKQKFKNSQQEAEELKRKLECLQRQLHT